MRFKTFTSFAATGLIAFALPIVLTAQEDQNCKKEHQRYKLIDIGTLGGPVSFVSEDADASRILNNQGMVAGGADTSEPDPYAPNCFEPDCFVHHAFRWKDGVLTDLGALPGASSAVGAINNQGWIAGFSWTGEIDPLLNGPAAHAVLWKHDQIIDLGTLGGYESNGVYVSGGGQVVGFSTINGPPDPFGFFGGTLRAFVWENGVMQDLETLGGPDSFLGYACTNLDNALAVGASLTNSIPTSTTGFPTTDPFLWDKGTILDLGTLGGTFGFAQCANNRRQVIGDSNLAGDQTQHAFVWERGVLRDLGTLGGDNSDAVAITDSGLVVGGADLPGSETHHGFLWKHGVMTDLGGLYADPCSNAVGVNIRGQVVGDANNCRGVSLHAFLWESGGPMVDLNTLIPPNSSLQLLVAVNINDRSEIVGLGVPQGISPEDKHTHAHVFILIPCAAGDSEGCEAANEGPAAMTQANRTSVSKAPIRVTERRPTPGDRVASFRARLARRYRIPSIGIPKD